MRTCTVDTCDRPVQARGFCNTHYSRWRLHGSPDGGSHHFGSLAERLAARTDRNGPVPSHRPDLGPCWIWTGAHLPDGYGHTRTDDGGHLVAHRASYEHHLGPIPEGRQLDHLCLNKGCVNPGHLEPVTNGENQKRRYAAARSLR